MQSKPLGLNRREFVSTSLLATLATASAGQVSQAADEKKSPFRICAFEEFLQALSYDELAEVIAELGFVGIEATVRNKGHVLPERVEEDLPKLVEAFKETRFESDDDGFRRAESRATLERKGLAHRKVVGD